MALASSKDIGVILALLILKETAGRRRGRKGENTDQREHRYFPVDPRGVSLLGVVAMSYWPRPEKEGAWTYQTLAERSATDMTGKQYVLVWRRTLISRQGISQVSVLEERGKHCPTIVDSDKNREKFYSLHKLMSTNGGLREWLRRVEGERGKSPRGGRASYLLRISGREQTPTETVISSRE